MFGPRDILYDIWTLNQRNILLPADDSDWAAGEGIVTDPFAHIYKYEIVYIYQNTQYIMHSYTFLLAEQSFKPFTAWIITFTSKNVSKDFYGFLLF